MSDPIIGTDALVEALEARCQESIASGDQHEHHGRPCETFARAQFARAILAILARVEPEPAHVVTTVAELKALPVGTVLHSNVDDRVMRVRDNINMPGLAVWVEGQFTHLRSKADLDPFLPATVLSPSTPDVAAPALDRWPAWDGEWRTLTGQTPEEARRILMTHTKEQLVESVIASEQEVIQGNQFTIAQLRAEIEALRSAPAPRPVLDREAVRESLWSHEQVRNINLGQWRSEIECSCGHIYRTDAHAAESGVEQEAWEDHITDALMALIEGSK